MNQRIHNLSKWRFLPEGEALHFSGRAQRTVVVDVNCPQEVCFYIRQDPEDERLDPERERDEEAGRVAQGDSALGRAASDDDGGSVSFIAVCKGRDRLEFGVDGSFDLLTEGGSAYVFSHDGVDIATRVIAPVIFTRIANRRQRNPHLEMMEYQMRLNQQRFMDGVRAEVERRVGALERKEEEYVPQRDIRAPDALVGKSGATDSSGDGEPERADDGASAVESGASEPVSKKRRKAADADEA